MIIRLRSRDGLERIQVRLMPAPAIDHNGFGSHKHCVCCVLSASLNLCFDIVAGSFSSRACVLAFCEPRFIKSPVQHTSTWDIQCHLNLGGALLSCSPAKCDVC